MKISNITKIKNNVKYGVILLLIPLLIPTIVDATSITVTSPMGSEIWILSTTHSIKWISTGDPGSNVKIELFKDGILNRVISASTANDGSKSWTVPSNQAIDGYQIKITNNSNLSDFGFSDLFYLGSPIKVVSPNGGEIWKRGTSHTINWDSIGKIGSNVRIELFKGGSFSRTISSSTANDGSYSWAIPSSQTLEDNYKIKITSTSNSMYTDMSDNNFSISNPNSPIQVIYPNGGESIDWGTRITIRWKYTSNSGGHVKIQLLKSGALFGTITSSTSNDGSYAWVIPYEYHNSNLRIRIISTSNSAYRDTSDHDFYVYNPGN